MTLSTGDFIGLANEPHNNLNGNIVINGNDYVFGASGSPFRRPCQQAYSFPPHLSQVAFIAPDSTCRLRDVFG